VNRSCFFVVIFYISVAAQSSAPAPSVPASNRDPVKLSPAAELALDAAKRWTDSAIADATNLKPAQRDIVLVHLAHLWKDVDHETAEHYLKEGFDHLRSDAAPDSSPENKSEYSFALQGLSTEVREMDRKMWDRLIEELPDWSAAETIAMEAQNLAISDDVAGAMDLERKSLSRGGSMADANVLESLIGVDPAAAVSLFDQIVTTAAKAQGDSNMLTMLTQDVFSERGDPETKSFFNQERQQRLLDVLAQLTFSGKEKGACNYSFEVVRLLSRFPTALQGQLQPLATECEQGRPGGDPSVLANQRLRTTDDLVRAMNEVSNPRDKVGLRELAARKAAQEDHDYERAIHLCLDASQAEREQEDRSFDPFDHWALNYASMATGTAVRKHDDVAIQRLLEILPPAMKASVELDAIRMLGKQDKMRALLMLSDARAILEVETPLRSESYLSLLRATADLSPADLNAAWRVLVRGLNRFDDAWRNHAQLATARSGHNRVVSLNRLDPWPLSAAAITDESFVRASIEDLASGEIRETLRMGVAGAFLARYTDAQKERPTKPATSITAARN
jgi:hypothetical protein